MINKHILSSADYQKIENLCMENGMPIAALMEKAGLKLVEKFKSLFPCKEYREIGILVGPGHNGGDALVMARELLLQGYKTEIFVPGAVSKELCKQHLAYYQYLGGSICNNLNKSCKWNVIIDGLFGFGLKRNLANLSRNPS